MRIATRIAWRSSNRIETNLSHHGTSNGGSAFERSGGVVRDVSASVGDEAYFEGFDPGSE